MKRLLILFLLISTASANDFNVTWIPVKEDIVNKEYIITIQNLDTDMRTVDIKSFFEDTNFDTSQVHDVQLMEYESKKFESKVLKKSKIQKEVSHGKITFPSVKSIGKKNNKGTKTFILKFKTPPDGSYGKVGLKINGKEYHPYWNSTWSNRKKITLTGTSSGSQTDYQLLLNVTYEPEMNLDFSDVRFCNDTDQLPAWLESKINESYALIWVKFPHTPADGETEDYWMYYGNSGASAYWDGEATFEFFDDFSNLTGFASRWSGSYQSISGGEITLADGDRIDSVSSYGIGYVCRSRLAPSTISGNGVIGVGFEFQVGANNLCAIDYYQSSRTTYIRTKKDGTGTVINQGTSTGSYHIQESIRESTSSNKFRINDGELWDITTNIPIVDLPITIGTRSGYSETGICDWIFIRKYASPEPTYSFSDTGYYVDSIYFNSSNSYYNLIDYKGDIAVNHSYYLSDDLEWTAQAVDDDTGFVVTLIESSEIDFITYEGILDWLQLVNLDNSKIYTLQNSSGDIEEHQASGNAVNFTTDLSPDNYEIEITAVPTPSPTVTPTGVQPANYSGTKLSDSTIKSFYYPFMYILFIVIIIGGFMHVFGN